MQLPDEKELSKYDKWGKARPTHEEHGITDTVQNPLGEQLINSNPRNWRMEGNQLIADTDFGELRQNIPVDYVCLGTDKANLPILKKILND